MERVTHPEQTGAAESPQLTTHQKSLRINLDAERYGTFAEIGAGQEVARWFFQAGAAAGTISKSMSAYDMAVSDAIYGHCARYVSRERLQSMLDHEHALNLERLGPERGNTTAFFVFANTVAALSFKGTNECHGWIGVKYQAHPKDADSQIVIHVRMLDRENALQQEALGIVGVNLLYAAFFLHYRPELILESLLDNLSTHRIEVDMIEFSGIEFRYVDNRCMSLRLVQLGLTGAAMFGPAGETLQPSEILHKRPVLVERGSFRPVTRVNIDMIESARRRFAAEPEVKPGQVVELMEITMSNLLSGGHIDLNDFLARAEVLGAAGKTVLISDYSEYYRLAAYLTRHTAAPIGIVMGVANLQEIFQPRYYGDLPGGILEACGRLFTGNLRLYVYPMRNAADAPLITAETAEIPGDVRSLYRHLTENGKIRQLDDFDETLLNILSRDVLRRIKDRDNSWEEMVPPEIAEVIRNRRFFGFQPQDAADESRPQPGEASAR